MKKLFLAGLAVCMLGCKTPVFMMGMTETEFKKANRSASLILATIEGTSIYRRFDPLREKYDFFYFERNKLVKYEESFYPELNKYIPY